MCLIADQTNVPPYDGHKNIFQLFCQLVAECNIFLMAWQMSCQRKSQKCAAGRCRATHKNSYNCRAVSL